MVASLSLVTYIIVITLYSKTDKKSTEQQNQSNSIKNTQHTTRTKIKMQMNLKKQYTSELLNVASVTDHVTIH